MSQQDKMVTVRMPLDLYQQVREDAESQGTSLSDVVREAVMARYETAGPEEGYEAYLQAVQQLYESFSRRFDATDQHFQSELEGKVQQLDAKDQQIDQLHQLLAMKEKHTGDILERLEQAQLQLEDLRQRRTVWQRFKGAFVST